MTAGCRTVALPGGHFVNWGGGIDFLRSCSNALSFKPQGGSERLFLVIADPGNQTVAHSVKSLLTRYGKEAVNRLGGRMHVVRGPAPFTRGQLTDSFRNVDHGAQIEFYPAGRPLEAVIREIGADVVIPSSVPLGRAFPVPWIGYLYDFQHKYYPGNFSARECRKRDADAERMLREAKAVVVNSASVKADVDRFYPGSDCRVFSLPFSAAPVASWFEEADHALSGKYELPETYFAICNQFWIHKEHATAFRALAEFTGITGRQDVHVVCTGLMEDYRQPGYTEKLRAEIRRHGLEKRIRFLGHLPKRDQIAVLRGSIAVLQPTLFEGGPGGGAVYDAVAMGVPAILSDIPVNLEIRGEEGLFYFQAGSAEDMAARMVEVAINQPGRPSKDELLDRGRVRTIAFGTALREAIDYVTGCAR
jgi:glycosyltransferase involved in cell wall biosynthesis